MLNEIWVFTGHTGNVKAVVVDSDDNVYSVSDDDTVRKINSSGVEVWSFTEHTLNLFAVAVDSIE